MNNYFQDELVMSVNSSDKAKLKSILMQQIQSQMQTQAQQHNGNSAKSMEDGSTRPPSTTNTEKGWMAQYKKIIKDSEEQQKKIQYNAAKHTHKNANSE